MVLGLHGLILGLAGGLGGAISGCGVDSRAAAWSDRGSAGLARRPSGLFLVVRGLGRISVDKRLTACHYVIWLTVQTSSG